MYVSVTDIKNYVYCPFIVYIRKILNIDERVTEYMLYGREIEKEKIILTVYRMVNGVKTLRSLVLRSERLRLIGCVDYVIIDKYGQYIPVDVKWCESDEPRKDHKAQLCAYAMLIEDNFNTKCKFGILYYVTKSEGKLFKVYFVNSLRKYVLNIIDDILSILKSSTIPKHTPNKNRCRTCPYSNLCNFKYS